VVGQIFQISGLIIGLTSSVLIIILLKYGFTKIHYTWALFNLAVGSWGFANFFTGLARTESVAIIFWKLGIVSGIFTAIIFYHVIVFLGDLRRVKLLICFYFYGCLFSFLTLFNLSGLEVSYVYNSIFYAKASDSRLAILSGIWGGILFYALHELYKLYIKSSDDKKVQFKYLLIGFAIGFTGATLTMLPWFGFVSLPYPAGNILIWFYLMIVTYAILRHKLLDIEIIVKKTLVFAGLLASVFAILILPTLLIQEFILRSASFSTRMTGLAISGTIIILTMRRIETFLINVTDKYLFQKKYDYKQVVKSFIDEVITLLSLDSIIQRTIDLLDKTLHPETMAVLLLNKHEDKYTTYRSAGYSKDVILDNASKIPTLMKTTKDIFSVEGHKGSVEASKDPKEEMKSLNASLAIPLMLHDDLIGIMLLGKKRSDEEYSQEDLDILTDLARTEAIAIGNAQLFAETAQNERRAAIGTLAAGINHEIGNPLNIINTKIQVYLMSLEGGLYKDKDPKDVIKEARDIMKICLGETSRISEITKKLSNFARPSKDFKPEATDIEEQIDASLAVVGHELEIEQIEIRKEIEKNLPKIMADKRQIQQIFFNILKNAGQAIKDKGIIEIKAYDNKDGNISIEITDNGCGIPEDKLDKIYEPFYTTKEQGSGTGLGLSIVRQLVWRNRGDIKVRSVEGKSTTFIMTFTANK